MTADDERSLDDLSQFWNGVVHGADPDPGALDPELVETVRLLHGRIRRPAPDPDFARRLREALVDATGVPAISSSQPLPPATAVPNGREPKASLDEPANTSTTLRRVWPFLELAAAVLLIAAFGIGALVGYRNLPLLHDDRTASGEWSMYRGGPAHTGATGDSGPEGAPTLRWTFTPDAPIYPAVVVAGGVAYVTGDEDHVYAVDAATGQEIWRFAIGATVTGTPAVAGGVLYLGTNHGTLYAIDATTGAERWHLDTGGPICCSPALTGDTLYVGTDAGDLLALDLAGKERWRYRLDGASWSSPAVAGGTVYVGTNRRVLYALDAATGTERWQVRLAGREVPAVAVAVADGMVYVGTWHGALYALDAATGAERWHLARDTTVFTPAIGNGLVYAGSENGILYALDAATGAERWRFVAVDGIITPPSIAENTVYVGSLDGYVYALDAATGAERWRFGAASVAQGPIVADGMVYVTGANGVIYAIGGGGETEGGATPVVPLNLHCSCGNVPWRR